MSKRAQLPPSINPQSLDEARFTARNIDYADVDLTTKKGVSDYAQGWFLEPQQRMSIMSRLHDEVELWEFKAT